MSSTNWQELIQAATANRQSAVNAQTYCRKKWGTNAAPVVLSCDDGNVYVVKCHDVASGRVPTNEQIVATLGKSIGAPVADVRLVDVPKALIDAESELSHMKPGISHGSRLIPGCSESQGITHIDVPSNRNRFALLAVLYGWIPASDQQLIYALDSPHAVHSVDHGHFFPGGPAWTLAGLSGAPPATPFDWIVQGVKLTTNELENAIETLQNITSEYIATAVAAPLDQWGILPEERVALAEYLALRKEQLTGYAKAK
jgi:HipA-like kinase